LCVLHMTAAMSQIADTGVAQRVFVVCSSMSQIADTGVAQRVFIVCEYHQSI